MTQAPTLDRGTALGAALGRLDAAVRDVAGVPTWMLSARDLPSAVQAIARAETQLAAARLALIREAIAQGVPADAGITPAGWLRSLLNTDPHTPNEDARVAAALADPDSPIAAALAAGSISVGHARVITRTVRQLRADKVDQQQVAKAERFLLTHSRDLDPLLLSRLGRSVRYHLAPDDGDLEKEEQQQIAKRELTFYPDPDGPGMTHVRGRLDPEVASIVQTALDPLALPSPPQTAPRTAAPRPGAAQTRSYNCARRPSPGRGCPRRAGSAPLSWSPWSSTTCSGCPGCPRCSRTGYRCPPRRRERRPATPASCPSCSAPRRSRWMLGGASGCGRPGCAAPWPPATAAAPARLGPAAAVVPDPPHPALGRRREDLAR